ncbi:hypothetical protein T484DRAFT_1624671 [Baffinella frigidus]|nr:hypothetical protein T484DRAFT_1624671 [Cryptophyta sp. CCMP2293]
MRVPSTGSTLNPSSTGSTPKPETRNPKPDTRTTIPETRNPKKTCLPPCASPPLVPETRNPKPETRNPIPETRYPKPKTRNRVSPQARPLHWCNPETLNPISV